MPGKENAKRAAQLLLLLAGLLAVCIVPAASRSAGHSALDLDGHTIDPFRVAGSKIVVFVFVRADCPISNRYAPTIQQLASQYGERAAFFLVYPIASETPQQIRKHLQDYGYHLPALRDPDLMLARESQIRITPEAAVFSSDKKLLYHGRIDNWYVEFGRSRSAPTTHDLASALESAVSGSPVSVTTEPAVGCFIPGLT
jgi:thiol-disulfide isomerase/thioredoxin